MTTNFPKPEPEFAHKYCSINQAAAATGLSPALVAKMVHQGKLPAYRSGRTPRHPACGRCRGDDRAL